jgi:hypothetical protein
MENENVIPFLRHRLFVAEINNIIQNRHALSGSSPISNCLSHWGIWLVDELIQKQAIFCLSCGNFNLVHELHKFPNRIICNNPEDCLQGRIVEN